MFFHLTEDMRLRRPVDERNDEVHYQYRVRHALGITAPGAYQRSEDAAADGEDYLPAARHRRRDVVGRHEDSAEQQSARKHLIERRHRTLKNKAQHRDGSDVDDGDVPFDYVLPEKDAEAYQKGYRRGLSDASADASDEEVLKARELVERARLDKRERRRAGDPVYRPGRHRHGPAGQHHRAARERGVHDVAAEAAEEMFDDYHSEKAAEHRHPERNGRRQVVGEKQPRDRRGKVVHRAGLLDRLFPEVLKKHARGDADRHDNSGAEAEEIYAGEPGGGEGREHPSHDLLSVERGVDVRRA